MENWADDKQESLEILDALIPGSDVNAPYSKGTNGMNNFDQFLLLTAVRRGILGFVRALLEAGANVTLKYGGAIQLMLKSSNTSRLKP